MMSKRDETTNSCSETYRRLNFVEDIYQILIYQGEVRR